MRSRLAALLALALLLLASVALTASLPHAAAQSTPPALAVPTPSPLPVWNAGAWSRSRVAMSASVCPHPRSGPTRDQWTKPLLWQDRIDADLWWTLCFDDAENFQPSVGIFGSYRSSSAQFTPALLQPVTLSAIAQAQSGILYLLMSTSERISSSVYSFNGTAAGNSSLTLLKTLELCTTTMLLHDPDQLLMMCMDPDDGENQLTSFNVIDHSVRVLWSASITADWSLLGNEVLIASSLPVNANVSLAVVDRVIIGSDAPSAQQLLNSSECVVITQAIRSPIQPNQVYLGCAITGLGPTLLAVWDELTQALTLFDNANNCDLSDGGMLMDSRGTLYLTCSGPLRDAGGSSSALMHRAGKATVLVASDPSQATFILAVDRSDGSVWYTRDVTPLESQGSLELRSVSGSDFVPLLQDPGGCFDLSEFVVDSRRGIVFAVCSYNVVTGVSLVTIEGGRIVASLPLFSALMFVQAIALADPDYSPDIDVFIVAEMNRGTAADDYNSGVFAADVSSGKLALLHLVASPIYVNRMRHVGGRLIGWGGPDSLGNFSTPISLDDARGMPVFGDDQCLQISDVVRVDDQLIFACTAASDDGSGAVALPLNFIAPVLEGATLLVPVQSCSRLIGIHLDDAKQQLWLGCEQGMQIFDLATQSLLPSRTHAYPSDPNLLVVGFVRDAVTEIVYYAAIAPVISNNRLFISDGPRMFGMPLCFNLNIGLNTRTSTLYSCFGQNLYATTSAFACSAGFGWNQGCQLCTSGTAHPNTQFNATLPIVAHCTACPPGSTAFSSGSAVCSPCAVGSYQAHPSDEVCSPCAPGWSQNRTGQIACNACPPGFVAQTIQSEECTPCGPGSYALQNRSSTCQLCDRGTASDAYGLDRACGQCQLGTEAQLYGATSCSACLLGSSAESGGFCNPCSVNTYTPVAGAPCVSCADSDQSGLLCSSGIASVQEGYWAWLDDSSPPVYRTTACPYGFCPGSALQSAPARFPNDSASSNVTATPQLCAWPRLNDPSNFVCAECEPGFLPWGAQCDRCTQANGALISLLLLACFAIVVYLLITGSSAGHVSVLLYFVQIAALQLPPAADWLSWIKFANLGASSVHSCLAPLTPLQQTLLTICTPLILLAVLAAIGCVHALLAKLPQCAVHLRSSLTRDRYTSAVLSILLFSYTAVALACVQALHCVEFAPGVRRLFSTPTVDCESSEYRSFLPLLVLVLILFVAGMPLTMLVVAWRKRRSAHAADPLAPQSHVDISHSLTSSSDLPSASPHRHRRDSSASFVESLDASFWRPFVLARRFAFVLVATLLGEAWVTRNSAFGVLHFATLLLHLYSQPFHGARLNQVESASHALLFLLASTLVMSTPPLGIAPQLILFLLVVPMGVALLVWAVRVKASAVAGGLRSRKSQRESAQPSLESSQVEREPSLLALSSSPSFHASSSSTRARDGSASLPSREPSPRNVAASLPATSNLTQRLLDP